MAAAVGTRLLFGGSLPVVFLVFPFALWAALRHGPGVTAIVNAVVACIAVWATSRGHGPFAGHTTTVRIVVLDAFNAAVAVSSLMLAASVATAARLSAENERLHAQLRSRLDDVVASRARIVATTDDERRNLERNLHDGAQQRLVALSYLLGLQTARLRADADADADGELRAALTRAQHEIASRAVSARRWNRWPTSPPCRWTSRPGRGGIPRSSKRSPTWSSGRLSRTWPATPGPPPPR